MATKAALAASEHFLQYRIQWSSIVFVWYDFFLTFGDEVRYIWSPIRTRARTATVFIFLRYPLVANVLYLLAISHDLPDCNIWYQFIGALSVLGRAAVIITLTLRTVSVYKRNKYVIALLLPLAVACITLDISHVPGLRCKGSSSIPIVPQFLAALVLTFELSVAVLIFARSLKLRKDRLFEYRSGGLLDTVIDQGLLYFCGVFGFQLTALVLDFVETDPILERVVNAYTLPMSCVLVARATLSLLALDQHSTASNASITDPDLTPPEHTIGSLPISARRPGSGLRRQANMLSTIQFAPHGGDSASQLEYPDADYHDEIPLEYAYTYGEGKHSPEGLVDELVEDNASSSDRQASGTLYSTRSRATLSTSARRYLEREERSSDFEMDALPTSPQSPRTASDSTHLIGQE